MLEYTDGRKARDDTHYEIIQKAVAMDLVEWHEPSDSFRLR